MKFLCTLWGGICSGLWDCAASFTAQILIPGPHTPFNFCKLWRNTVCKSEISFKFSSSWPSPLVNLPHAVTLSLVKLSMLSSKPAFAISPKSQISNLKICSSLSRRKGHAGTTCLMGWREERSWAAPSCPGIWVGSHHTSGEGGFAIAFPCREEGGRRRSALQKRALSCSMIARWQNIGISMTHPSPAESTLPLDPSALLGTASLPDVMTWSSVRCFLRNYRERCVFPNGECLAEILAKHFDSVCLALAGSIWVGRGGGLRLFWGQLGAVRGSHRKFIRHLVTRRY